MLDRRNSQQPDGLRRKQGFVQADYLQKIGWEIKRRLLEVELVSHNSGLSGGVQHVVQPTVSEDGETAPLRSLANPE